MAYSVILGEAARKQFLSLDKSVREKVAKKLIQLEREDFKSRHLKHGASVFVEETGQYRVVFKTREDLKQKRVVFVGSHKEYEKWFKSQA